ncbi:hypothetical protein chiPu_0023223 [Chiloscyllium punctatum]|uniref:Reverse transcriptase domain-containing protein n=1 Tax=Chiloscyllium punctatum TaxID=137246 RepID=A0A401T9W2_CHIPU|nr:hypothetical protein [Chiloscyllium punctatum]
MMLSPDTSPTAEGQWADIYWGLLEPENRQNNGTQSLYSQWRPWVQMLHPYALPADPLYVTLYYDRDDNDIYQHAFYQHLEGTQWEISSSCILLGKEGVAGVVELTAEQLERYEMSEEAIPHLTLAVHAKYQAKDLGPMSKRLMALTDWVWTQLPGLQYSPSEEAYRIIYRTTDKVLLEHRQIERFHGREKTDHPQAATMLDTLPDTLWSTGSTDVGYCKHVTPITFDLIDHTPIWQRQYSHKPEADAGIADTIEGLLAAGVLEPSHSAWNTPILPVEKQNTGKYRMADDLRWINSVVSTPTVPVPNPYTAMSVLTPKHKWFSCIDLANAFFCLPLADHLRDIFSFTHKGQKLRYTRVH